MDSRGRLEQIFISVDADGLPPVIHRGAYDGTRKRADTLFSVNLGGIAGIKNSCPIFGGRGIFYSLNSTGGTGPSINHHK